MQENKLEKKRAIITGADGGMGHVITKQLALAGYNVLMLCHSFEKGDKCRRQLIKETGNNQIELRTVELSSLSDVHRLSQEIVKENIPVDLLMNNAARICTTYERTEEGFEKTIAINYLAPYILTYNLLPLLHAGSRIVNMSSLTARFGKITLPDFFYYGGRKEHFHRLTAYSNSKLALWWMTIAMSEKVKKRGITVNAADPGVVSTNILSMHNPLVDTLCNSLFRPFTRSVEKGAQTALFLLLSPEVKDMTGQTVAGRKIVRLPKRLLNSENYQELWTETERICRNNHFIES